MAKNKVKKEKRKAPPKVLKFPPIWLENKNLALRARTFLLARAYNKIATARKLGEHPAARAVARYGAPAGVALLAFFIIYSLFLPKDRFQLTKERLVKNPNDFAAHLILAEEYLKNNQFDKAEKELLTAEQITILGYSDARVLGEAADSTLKSLWQKKQESDPEDIEKLIKYWEQIISEKPDYRDGYLQLALLHYKLYENEKAKEYLQKALELDPNFEPAREIEKMLSD